MAVNGGHAGTKKGPNWGHVMNDFRAAPTLRKERNQQKKKNHYLYSPGVAAKPAFSFADGYAAPIGA